VRQSLEEFVTLRTRLRKQRTAIAGLKRIVLSRMDFHFSAEFHMSRYSRRTLLLVALAALAPLSQAVAQGGYVASDRFGYSGSVTRYNTLADLQANANGTTFGNPQRDLSLFMINGNAGFANQFGAIPATESIFLTAWWFSPANDGVGNPNNQNTGFLQLYDNDGATLSSMTTQWNDAGRTSFSFSASGSNTIPGCTSMPPQDSSVDQAD